MKALTACALVCVAAITSVSASGGPADVSSRAKAAQKVVVATVLDLKARYAVNQWGDELIVSDVQVRVDEVLKGASVSTMTVTVEGGTIGDLTLDVSDMPSFKKGDRAVLFVDQDQLGAHHPNGRGRGLYKLNADDRTEDGELTLNEIKRLVREAR